ncbi:translation initiation factor IF-2-like [Phacochoerus africanus]|uniref:translation initiation factor IF-2-like n=1 Tax=Phacochoerus africanus TaxID=41426 RepID=UPI001FD9FEB4|nr:translation initiation factor IF-2-like [Phacochoerus africanus]
MTHGQLSSAGRREKAGPGRAAGLRAPARPPSAAAQGPLTPTWTPTPPLTPTSAPTPTRRPTRPRRGARCPGETPGLQEGRPGACWCLGGAHGVPDSVSVSRADTEKLLPAARPDSGRRSPTSSRGDRPLAPGPRGAATALPKETHGALMKPAARSGEDGGTAGETQGASQRKPRAGPETGPTLSPQRSS